MNIEKKQYIENEIKKTVEAYVPILLLIGGIGILFLGILDYFVTPENFKRFIVYRGLATTIYFLLYLIHKTTKKYSTIITVLAAITVAIMVEAMILSFGGHQSPYYAGMIIIFIFLYGLLPFSFKVSLFVALLLYSIYLVPILLFDEITNTRIFINNNIFLIATLLGGLVWRYINFNVHIKKLSLEYDLAKEQERLKQYSEHLEDLVAERTKELVKSQAMLKALHEHANDGIIIFDRNGIIKDVNNKACEIHGYTKEELIGANITMLEHEDNLSICQERIKRLLNGESLVFETEHRRKDGTKVVLEVSSCAIRFDNDIVIESFLRDVTDKKQLQNQLMHAQKMESIGTLAGGIAHDFNNILTSILGYASMLVEYPNLPTDVLSKLRVIEASARKASNIVSKLLSFARKKGKENLPFSINNVIEDSLIMTSKLIPENIEIKVDLDPNQPIVTGDVTQIEQVIVNLLINAKDAMPNGGTITIRTSVENLNSDKFRFQATLKPGKYVKLEIHDTGVGIPTEIMDRIFEPFFTTKEVGKGTGLGLAMVYGIVKDHGGYIFVDSKQNEGTTFTIYLPVTDHAPVVKEVERPVKKMKIGEVVVVDDELPVLQFVKEVLSKDGYDVTVFQNPFVCLEYFRSHKKEISVVITDILMPQMDGGELIKRIKAIKKEIHTIAMSGFVDALSDVKADQFLEKPLKKDALLNALNSIDFSKQ